ncbi:MAG: molybdate ABC transporter substrate-binding protein [Desulfurococcaceae archaeon]
MRTSVAIALVAIALAASLGAYVVYQRVAGRASTAAELLVYAPPVVSRYLNVSIPIFESGHSGVRVQLTYGATGRLMNQINLTGTGDVFVVADSDYMLKAMRLGMVRNDTVRVISWQVIAIIVPKGNPKNITSIYDLARPGLKVAIPDPSVAPGGAIAVEILKAKNIYDKVKDNLVVLPDMAAVAQQVALGAVDAALAWNNVVYWYPGSLDIVWLNQSDLLYSGCQLAAVLRYSKSPGLAAELVDFLASYPRQNRSLALSLGMIVDASTLRALTPYTSIPGDRVGLCGALGAGG